MARERKGSGDELYVSLTLANGVGGAPAPLAAPLVRLQTADGLLHVATDPGRGPWVVDGRDPGPSVTDQLTGGAAYAGWVLAFEVDGYASAPVAIVYEIPGATAGDASFGDGRRATAPVAFEACTPCGAVCTYTDRDAANCGACGRSVADDAYHSDVVCRQGRPACADPATTVCPAQAPSAGFQCVDLTRDGRNCGACGNFLINASCTNGTPTCPGQVPVRDSDSDGRTGWRCADLASDAKNCGAVGHSCAADIPNTKGVFCRNRTCGAVVTVGNPGPDSTSCTSECKRHGLVCDDTFFTDSKGHTGGERFHAYESSSVYKCESGIDPSFDGSYAECACMRP